MHHEFCNVTVPACRTQAGFCDCNGNGLFEPQLNETGWDCHKADTLEWYEKQPGYNHRNVAVEYRHALYGVDCADYCPEVCQFIFYNASTCSSDYYSYELHANPFGYIRETASYKWYQHRFWGNVTPTWKAVHINNNNCKIRLSDSLPSDTNKKYFGFADAGCHRFSEKGVPGGSMQPYSVESTEVCLQAETFYKKTSQDATTDTGFNTKVNNQGNGQ